MSKLYNTKFKPTKAGIIKAVGQKIGSLIKGKGKVSPTITKVDPFVPKTKAEISARDLRRAKQARKTSEVKLDNTVFRINQQKKRLEEKRDKKMGGGFMGKRMGYSKGTPRRKTNVEKLKKAFTTKTIKFDAKKSDLDKSGDLSKYEKARGMAIAKAMAKRKNKKVI